MTMRQSPDGATVIDLPQLRAAFATLERHADLLKGCIAHEAEGATSIHPDDIHDAFVSALAAIIEGDWRPDWPEAEGEERGEPFQREYDDAELAGP